MEANTRNPFGRQNLVGEVVEQWQGLLDLAAEILGVPAGLITRVDGPEIEIFLSSASRGNPYQAGFKTCFPNSGFYCEWAIKHRRHLIIPDARRDADWKDNAAVAMNMISYAGMPIARPDGEMFGTICFLDCKANSYNETYLNLLGQLKGIIELSLRLVFANEEIGRRDRLFQDLTQIFPICSYCKKVQGTSGDWVAVENYIAEVAGKRFSHGACPQCFEREIAVYSKP
jgi:GAF domain-containing protein